MIKESHLEMKSFELRFDENDLNMCINGKRAFWEERITNAL